MGALRRFRVAAVVLAIGCAAPVLADDPYDPTMTPEAIARDRAEIRRLNRAQQDYVRQRDAGYAQGWRDYQDAGRARPAPQDTYAQDQRDYAAMRSDYAEQRRRYDQALRNWREDVDACRAGYYERCAD